MVVLALSVLLLVHSHSPAVGSQLLEKARAAIDDPTLAPSTPTAAPTASTTAPSTAPSTAPTRAPTPFSNTTAPTLAPTTERKVWVTWNIDDTTQSVLGDVATVLTMFLFFSPLPTMRKVIRAKATLGFSFLPYLSTFFNCSLWVAYAINVGIMPSLITNAAGVCFAIVWMSIFTRYATAQERKKLISLLFGGSCVLVAVFVPLVMFDQKDFFAGASRSAFLMGLTADVFNVAMYGAPLSVIGTVVKTKSVRVMPFPISLFTTIVSSSWFTYGFYIGDIWVTIPNFLGIILGIVQLIIYAIYMRYPQTEVEGEERGEGEGEGTGHDEERLLRNDGNSINKSFTN